MRIENVIQRIRPARQIQGIAAALLPFEPGGQIAVEAFQRHLQATHRAGLMNAVNMDTGYVNYLSDEERRQVLKWTREALGGSVPFDRSGRPEALDSLLPYRWGFGVDPRDPGNTSMDEPLKFLALLEQLNIKLVNVTAGSPYYNPHIQRPALYPPSDGYPPPEDPLIGVARQMKATHTLKKLFPEMLVVGTAYTYLQDFLPYVAQAAVREGWVDCVGLGRLVLSYPELPRDVLERRPLDRKRFCRTFSDCTTGPRIGLPSGCYPLDEHYKKSEAGKHLREVKDSLRKVD